MQAFILHASRFPLLHILFSIKNITLPTSRNSYLLSIIRKKSLHIIITMMMKTTATFLNKR